MSLVLITPTRDRPEAFALCERWIARQTVRPDRWIVVDDGDEAIAPTLGQEHVRRRPTDDPCTLQENLLVALKRVREDKVLVIEDDEWYSPRYVEVMSALLDEAQLVGEIKARYYHVRTRRWNQHVHVAAVASLCRTGIRREVLNRLVEAAITAKVADDPYVDMRLWGAWPGAFTPIARTYRLEAPFALSVAIKGMPGRGGLGGGHAADAFPHEDPFGAKLAEWIGEDAVEYARFYEVQHASP